jgi:hypothetical protein
MKEGTWISDWLGPIEEDKLEFVLKEEGTWINDWFEEDYLSYSYTITFYWVLYRSWDSRNKTCFFWWELKSQCLIVGILLIVKDKEFNLMLWFLDVQERWSTKIKILCLINGNLAASCR